MSARQRWVTRTGGIGFLLAALSLGCDGNMVEGPGGTSSTGAPGTTSTASAGGDGGAGGTGGVMASTGGTGGVVAGTGGMGGSGGTGGGGPVMVPDFSLVDQNPNSLSYQQPVSPRDYLMRVSAWYFGHAT